MSVRIEVIESPIVRLHTGKFVETYATLYRTEGSTILSMVYNGFEGTAVTFLPTTEIAVESLILIATRCLVEQVRETILSGGYHV